MPHTPGPLKAERNTGIALCERDKQPWIVMAGVQWTALVCKEADAILYAAAPELLAACKAAATAARMDNWAGAGSVRHEAFQDLLAAIAKAQGGAP